MPRRPGSPVREPCSMCLTTAGRPHRSGVPIRINGSRFGLAGVLCGCCADKLYKRRARHNDALTDTDGLLGETEAEQRRIKGRIRAAFVLWVLPRYLNSGPLRPRAAALSMERYP